ncbi:hypothetical protein CPAR01_10859 [Colletotrichum paranaense]|uniref:Uncharacterized protein n=1 Tax=Colletotrichum paranaense TaxID=1914294 RepID=A0ABQ9S9Y8_9PEZI|nr:uncharacterized protein CPAR01_10859 [Colletotrichum paranaense]KAK1531210.1 hypothetical protein CPAR01_10859 [Colletotrichum paranaense]
MVNKEKAVKRCETLITHTRLLQQTTEKYQAEFAANAKQAYASTQTALKKAGLSSIDDLVKQVTAELPKKEADTFLAELDKMKPTDGMINLLTGGAKEFIDIGIYLSKTVSSFLALHYVSQIKKGLALESKAFTRIGHAYARTIAQRAVALEASQAALAASNSQMSASEIANLTEKFKIGTAEEIPIIEEQGGIALTSEEIVAQDALSVVRAGMLEEEIIGAEAIAAARGLARAGIYGLIAAVVIFGAMELFSSLREDAQAAKLKAIIDKTSTARLYVQVEEKTAVAYSSLNAEIENIAEAFVDREAKPQKFQKALDRFTKSAGNLLPNVDEVYAQLFEGDAQGGSWVGDDPSLEQMKSMHDDEIRVRNS